MKTITPFLIALMLITIIWFYFRSENYSNGERVGVITQFSNTGTVFKSHEGHLNVTQTGMNSSIPFDFSIDNDNESENLVKQLDSAANLGWKVKLVYHQTRGLNWFKNRGETNHFVTECNIIDRNFSNNNNSIEKGREQTNKINDNITTNEKINGRTIDTIYVVIYRELPSIDKK